MTQVSEGAHTGHRQATRRTQRAAPGLRIGLGPVSDVMDCRRLLQAHTLAIHGMLFLATVVDPCGMLQPATLRRRGGTDGSPTLRIPVSARDLRRDLFAALQRDAPLFDVEAVKEAEISRQQASSHSRLTSRKIREQVTKPP